MRSRRPTHHRLAIPTAAVLLLLTGALLGACASGGGGEASPYEFERDRERCWLQTTRGLSFQCPQGACNLSLPDRMEFAQCMEDRGWHMADPMDVTSPRRPTRVPPEDDPEDASEEEDVFD